MSRLKDKFNETIKPALVKEFDIKNPMLIPALEKIVISVGAGDSAKDQKVLQMYAFLDKLISVALPRVKDFRGLPKNGFDGRGNYNFGLSEQLMFPEVEYDKILRTHGMNITIATTAKNDKEAFKLLELFGVPFAKGK